MPHTRLSSGKTQTQKSKKIVSSISLVLLLTLSSLIALPISTGSLIENASANGSLGSATANQDMLQYEWPYFYGDHSFDRFSAGPAPEAPDILWKTTIKGIQSYISAFNGMIFCTTATNVIALDKDTGSVVWNTTLPARQRWPAVYKIDENHLVVGTYGLEIKTGTVLWESDEFSARAAMWSESAYSPEEKMFYVKTRSVVKAWSFSNPSKPPTVAWETFIPGGASAGSGIQYGDGKVFPGSYDPHQMALNATTGEVIWDTQTTGSMTYSGSYYKGKFFRGGPDNNFYAFDANTGQVLWTFNPRTPNGFWSSGSAAAYGKVYQVNYDGNLYALNADTGELVWKYTGPGVLFIPGWPVVADGKVYATTGQAVGMNLYTGEFSKSEFVCLDAFTGQLLWKLPIEAHAPRESTAIAYGNLYVVPAYSAGKMDTYTTFDEVWAFGSTQWPMWRRDAENSGTGQSGPTNLTLRWKFATEGAIISSPSVVDDKVYVGSMDKNIYSIDALTGRLEWNFTTGFGIKSSPAVVNGRVYVGPDDGYVYSLDAKSGDLIWKTYAGGYVPAHFDALATFRSSPAVVAGKVYVGSLDTNLYCLDANSGKVIWTFKTEGYITSSPAVVDGAVYVVSQEPNAGALYKVNANDGTLIWKLNIPYILIADRGTDMHASPTVADGMIFTPSNKNEYYAVNATSGTVEWKQTVEAGVEGYYLISSVLHHDGKIFYSDQFYLVSADAKTGKPIWKSWLGSMLFASPTYGDGKIYLVTDQRSILVLNATTGERLSHFETGSRGWSSPTLYKGRLYVGNHDMNVYSFVDAVFPTINTSIVADLSKQTINKTKSEAVTISGQLNPGITNAPIRITLVNPNGTIVNIEATTDDTGVFNASYTPDYVGNWTIAAHYDGAEYPSRVYTSTFTPDLLLEVVESIEPSLPTENTDLGYIYMVAAVVIITITGIAVLVLAKKAKIRNFGSKNRSKGS